MDLTPEKPWLKQVEDERTLLMSALSTSVEHIP
jgi:hypothetical protein